MYYVQDSNVALLLHYCCILFCFTEKEILKQNEWMQESPTVLSSRQKDWFGIGLNLFVICFSLFPFAGFVIFLWDMDPIGALFPIEVKTTFPVISFRLTILFLGTLTSSPYVATFHMIAMTLFHCTLCILIGLSQGNEGIRIKQYQTLRILFAVQREYMDTVMGLSLGTILLMATVSNYVVIEQYGNIPGYMYAYYLMIAVMIQCVIPLVVPIGGKNYDASKLLIQQWKRSSKLNAAKHANWHGRNRHALQYSCRHVEGLQPVWYGVSSFSILKRGGYLKYTHVMLDYTINAILSL